MQRDFISNITYWFKRKNRKPLVLRGARQVGKSTLVRMFAKSEGLHLYEINLERHRPLNSIFATLDLEKIISALEGVFKREIHDQNCLLFLDEIQATPDAIAALRYFYEDRPNLAVVAAGSLLEFVLENHTFSMPVGRIEYGYIGPLSFEEFLQARDETYLLNQVREFNFDKPWSDTLHQSLISQFKDYLFVGGMPEAVKAFLEGESKTQVRQYQQNIIHTYRDDFSKYAKQIDLERLQEIYLRLPLFIGKKVIFSKILPGERAEKVRQMTGLLEKAGIMIPAYHSDCDGIPITAQMDSRVFKPYWLDIGLLNQMLGLHWNQLHSNDELIIAGKLAEQFVSQELIHLEKKIHNQKLIYWLREGKKGNAEVDFVIQRSTNIIPIEVKSGSAGSLKSLMQMIVQKKLKYALRIDLNMPSKQRIMHTVVTPSGPKKVRFELLSLPPYLLSTYVSSLDTHS